MPGGVYTVAVAVATAMVCKVCMCVCKCKQDSAQALSRESSRAVLGYHEKEVNFSGTLSRLDSSMVVCVVPGESLGGWGGNDGIVVLLLLFNAVNVANVVGGEAGVVGVV